MSDGGGVSSSRNNRRMDGNLRSRDRSLRSLRSRILVHNSLHSRRSRMARRIQLPPSPQAPLLPSAVAQVVAQLDPRALGVQTPSQQRPAAESTSVKDAF